MSETDAWTTVRVTMPAADGTLAELEVLAALLAERDDVGGVELRDPDAIAEGPEFVAVERPELVAYTTPAGREAVVTAAQTLAERLGLRVVIDASDHAGDDWRDAWKRHYRPLRFAADGPGGAVELLIRPSWIAREADDPERELVLDPGRAFGTGLHESTAACLGVLVELAAAGAEAPRTVLDLGCGSGILGLAAARLWPEILEGGLPGGLLVLADHDPEAVETARENAVVNGLAAAIRFEVIELGGPEPPPELAANPAADLILANIRPEVLIPAAPAIIACLAPGGTLVLSGILADEAEAVRSAYAALRLITRRPEADWCALVLRR